MFFTIEKIEIHLKEIRDAIHREIVPIPRFKFFEGSFTEGQIPGAQDPDFDDSGWADFHVGEYWGGYDRVAWFRAWVPVPPEWEGQKLALRFLVGPKDGGNSTAESLLYVNGQPLQGIDVWHEDAWLPPEVLEDNKLFIALKAWSGVLEVPDRRRFKLAQLVWVDVAAERFYYLAKAILKTIKLLDENDLRRARLLELLNQAYRCIDFLNPRSPEFYRSLEDSGQFLAAGLARLQSSELKPRVIGVGHSHIDLAWLWRLCHTREKAVRTFSTVLHLMRQYPDYQFVHSSPQLYKYLKEDYPEIFARVKQKIASGEWGITGGMWVEADTNIPSGEALIRQILFGKRYVRDEFGLEMKVLWLPDVFGYSWALPQIIKKSGLDYFLTSKISWSQFNRFPYDTFSWRGIDGSEVLTHFVTTPEDNSWHYTYNGQIEPAEVKGIWDNYRQKDVNDELLLLYGWGDGGGGPTKEMLESALSLRAMPGVPEVELGQAEPFFERLEKRLAGKDLPVWDGELYLEYHRGTYTSQAYNKRANRKAEILYHHAEWLSALADVLTGQKDYPRDALRTGWELILLNQFHDILPGSSIRQVYEDSREDYNTAFAIGEQAVDRAQKALFASLSSGPESVILFNPSSWSRCDLVELPWSAELESKWILNSEGRPVQVQVSQVGGEKKLLFVAADVPALGYRAFPLFAQAQRPVLQASGEALHASALPAVLTGQPADGGNGGSPLKPNGHSTHSPSREADSGGPLPENGGGVPLMPGYLEGAVPEEEMQAAPDCLENPFYRIQINARGQIISLWDKRNAREVLASGARANVFQVFEDKPMAFDAWDTDIYYQEKMREVDNLVEAVVEETGPLRTSLRLSWQFSRSTITQRISIYRHSPRIDFATQIDWHEQQVLLKVAFPVAVRATRATYDIQFGNIERPTHWNTSWDYARFEAVGHKWVDLSEGNYGVSLLNDCKYGHDIKNNVLRLTVIKSAIQPDALADKGRHEFIYSLLPHAGDWRNSDVVREAYALNNPLLVGIAPARSGGFLPPAYQFARIDAEHVILETVKKAEDGDAWVVRVYEYKQCRSSAIHLTFGKPVKKAVACNLIEEEEEPVSYRDNTLTFGIAPYEIKTFKVWF